jgi:omega-6 fatty acid desaturase (delta-12 desaturase)
VASGGLGIWVQDNGIGIPKEQHERVFGLFQRLHGQDFYEGTGIGLAIVRKAVERMNGKVGVDSAPENGSRFWVELAAGAGRLPRNPAHPDGVALRVNAADIELAKKASMSESSQSNHHANTAVWKQMVEKYQQPSTPRAVWQMINTFGPYALLWYLMYRSLTVSWWLLIPLAVLTGAFTVRIFIIFHDCGHGSYFRSRTANSVVGFITGMLTFTPFYHWRWEHAIHHASAGHLDKRGVGDIWTLTVEEYLHSRRGRRLAYRLARNPIVLFLIAPLYIFLIGQRFASPAANKRERRSVGWMNLALLGMVVGGCALFGVKAYLLILLISVGFAGAAGLWLFYVQHQFEGVYWERGEDWDYTAAALQGSSFYKLPKILQWFSGNIGFHHIHHLSSRIPNYNLERCHKAHPLFQQVKPVTLFGSLKSLKFRLWDEERGQLIGFRHLRRLRQQRKQSADSH